MMRRVVITASLAVLGLAFADACVQAQQIQIQGPIQIQGQVQINGRVIIQGAQGQTGNSGNANLDGVFLPPDRNAKRRLDQARELLEQERYGEAVRLLGALLEGNEDYFFRPDPAQQVYRSLKAEAGRLLGEMPEAGLESYELQFGARARKMLEEAVAAGDIDKVAEVARRFFYTSAGGEATLLLGTHHWDHTRPLAAALCLSRLKSYPDAKRFEPMLSLLAAASWQHADDSERAKQLLIALKERTGGKALRLGNSEVEMFANEGQALAWLNSKIGAPPKALVSSGADWTMYRGAASRNASSPGTLPLLNPRWRVQCAEHPKVAEAIAQLGTTYRDQNIAALPSAFPLAVGNVVLMRTTLNLLAVDFATGKRIWEARSASDDSLDQLLSVSSGRQQLGLPPEMLTAIDQRVWSDAPFGILSSDGENVYAIEDLGIALPQAGNMRRIVAFNGRSRMDGAGPRDHNRLSAFELKTEGKLKWEVGGADGEDEPKLAGAFFLGAPLPLHGRLYAIAEMKGQEIRLVCVAAETGRVEWSQQLAVVDTSVQLDRYRREAGAIPSFADGILVCPTSAGAVVAIDLATRSLLWGFQYQRGSEDSIDRMQMIRMRMFNQTDRRGHDAWTDSSVTIASGRALLTPIESDQLYCLSLIDGSLQWKQDRGANLYVAGVHDGNVILIGRQSITAVSLADGKNAWPAAIELPGNASPSGRGFLHQDRYYLPLSSAEVAEIDLTHGRILSRARSRRGDVPGNLICFRGEVISQGTSCLESFYQLDALKSEVANRLKSNGNDAQALLRLGEITLDAGNIDESIKLFRRAYELAPDENSREFLVESLIAGLRVDFAKNRQVIPELEQLVPQSPHQLEYLRILAGGLHAAHEPIPALSAYLRIADLEPELEQPQATNRDDDSAKPILDEVAEGQLIRRSRWLRSQLSDLRETGSADQQAEVNRLLGERLTKAASSGAASELRRWIEIGGTHPKTDECRAALIARIGGSDDFLEREQLLTQLSQSQDKGRRPAALASLADLYLQVKQPELAAAIYLRLANEWGDTVVRDGKTGRELFENLSGPAKEALAAAKPFPVGLIESREDQPKRSLPGNRYQRSFDLAWSGDPGPFFRGSQVLLEPRQQSLVCVDELGNDRFRITMGDPNARRAFVPFNNPQFNAVSADRHVLIYSLGFQLMAFDALRPQGTPVKPLWIQNLNEQITGMNVNFGVHQRQVDIAWGENKIVAQDPYGRPIGAMGPILRHGIVAQRFRDLLCLDTCTGEVQWQRRNSPAGSEIFGDDEIVIAAPFDGGEAMVLNSEDGELLGMCRVPPIEQRMANVGRRMLTWRATDERSSMSLVDPWKNDTAWSYEFAANSKAAVVGEHAVGVMEPSGMFSLYSLPDGKRLIHEQLASERSLSSIILRESGDRLLLVTNSPYVKRDPRQPIQAAPGGMNNPLINGRLYAFDAATGAKLWGGVRVANHGLLLSQPPGLPVLIFLRSVHKYVGGSHEARTSILAIDKRNGRIAYKNDELRMAIGNVEFIGDRSNDTVSILMPGKTITLTCTNQPWPAVDQPPPKPTTPSDPLSRAVGGLLRAIDNTTRRAIGLPTAEEEADPFGEADKEADAPEAQPEDKESDAGQADAKRQQAKGVKEAAEKAFDPAQEAIEEAQEALEAPNKPE